MENEKEINVENYWSNQIIVDDHRDGQTRTTILLLLGI